MNVIIAIEWFDDWSLQEEMFLNMQSKLGWCISEIDPSEINKIIPVMLAVGEMSKKR